MTNPVLLTTTEVLAYLQVTRRTLYRLVQAGTVPAVRVGRQWRFVRSDLEAWLDGRRASRRRPIPSRMAGPTSSPDALRGRRVLVVTDDREVGAPLQTGLSQAMAHVDLAADGPAAIEQLTRESYDLLIIAPELPGLDSRTVIRIAKRFAPRIAVAVISGPSSKPGASTALKVGANGQLDTPIDVARALTVATALLGRLPRR